MSCVKPINSTTKSAEINNVDDLLFEIFLRLPLYSVRRFTAACKSWQSLITNPTFRKLWRKQNHKPSTGIFVSNGTFVPFLRDTPTTRFSDLKPGFRILQSCNGLMLCLTGTDVIPNSIIYHVYNPTTDACRTLPPIEYIWLHSMSLAFDPIKSSYYKVICFDSSDTLFVYSSESRSWKSFTKELSCSMDRLVVYWNGAIHWIRMLSYFNIEKKKVMIMPKPPGFDEWSKCDYFGESCDCLNYAMLRSLNSRPYSRRCSVDVYELKRDYSEWVLRYHVELDYPIRMTSVLSVVHGVEEDESFLVLKTGNRIVRYNIVNKTSEVLLATEGYFHHAFQYIESQYDV